MLEGYYWIRCQDGTHFVAFYEDDQWYCAGIEMPVDIDPNRIIHRIPEPTQ